jgi:DNA-binding GntR family transcriptional regulator
MRWEEEMRPRENEELADFSYRSITSMIVNNDIRPGDAILETELAQSLNISRTPVRQALERFVVEGLFKKKKKRGCVIPVPTPEEADKVFKAREIIEREIARQAALNRTTSDIEALKKILETEAEMLSSFNKEGYWLANEQFHFGIMKATKNPYLERYGNHIFRKSSIYIFFFDNFYRRTKKSNTPPAQKSPNQHVQLLEAIENEDDNQSAILMEEHIRYSLHVLTGV